MCSGCEGQLGHKDGTESIGRLGLIQTKTTIHWIPTYRLLESSLICKESTSHRTSRVMGVGVPRNRANGTGSHGSRGGHKRIECTRGSDSSVSIALKRCLGGSISMVAQSSAEKRRNVASRQMGSEVRGGLRTPWIKFRCHGRQSPRRHRDGRVEMMIRIPAMQGEGGKREKENGMVKKENKEQFMGEGNRIVTQEGRDD